jgi:hypothetical protein
MIDPKQIPDEAVEAMLRMVACASPDERTRQRIHYRASLAAALNAWPGASKGDARQWSVMPDMPILILPLPKEGE